MKDYKEWEVWKRSMNLVEVIYDITKKFPHEEQHGLTSQMRRAAVSVPSNLAEGHARISKQDRIHFFRIAFASSKELETQVEISRRLGYISEKDLAILNDLLSEVINRLVNFVFQKQKKN